MIARWPRATGLFLLLGIHDAAVLQWLKGYNANRQTSDRWQLL
jgi:hypothetical protein